jgi:heme/copper-type cytochrome/quinol oxidase subunit 2
MGGIQDYTFQNIIFVHDFVFIFLILIFWTILAYFILILVEYTTETHSKYFRLFLGDSVIPMDKWLKFLRDEVLILRHIKDVKTMSKNRKVMNQWIRAQFDEFPKIVEYAKHIKDVLNQVHNLKLEIIWTFIPIFIILELIFPSLSLIADDEISNKASLHTVHVIGNQWYWTYEVNAAIGIVKQVSNLVLIDDTVIRDRDYARLLVTTNAVSIPVGIKTSFFITSNDVAHSWAIQGLGLKIDAIPGRINLKTLIASKLGLYTGMCSELCGIEHGFMPISLQVLTLSKWGYNLEHANEKVLTYNDVRNVWYI